MIKKLLKNSRFAIPFIAALLLFCILLIQTNKNTINEDEDWSNPDDLAASEILENKMKGDGLEVKSVSISRFEVDIPYKGRIIRDVHFTLIDSSPKGEIAIILKTLFVIQDRNFLFGFLTNECPFFPILSLRSIWI